MNIFVLDNDPVKAAQYHNNKHTVKMILETAQLLSAALSINNIQTDGLYKVTHKNHPATRWAAESQDNMLWLYKLGLALCDEYTYRYGKEHKSKAIIEKTKQYIDFVVSKGLTPFVQCMPEEYKNGDTIQAYKDYYRFAKKDLLVYTKREVPEFIKDIGIQK